MYPKKAEGKDQCHADHHHKKVKTHLSGLQEPNPFTAPANSFTYTVHHPIDTQALYHRIQKSRQGDQRTNDQRIIKLIDIGLVFQESSQTLGRLKNGILISPIDANNYDGNTTDGKGDQH